ncbi:MBL fold metallo-hydrolase [Clostridium polyendosporum]|uniref:MBL fold metallo-hydrolase n=1 Tax=Clostridium polyendosporum TaxID=69208 RepID=A0A919RYX5_9CLOT|nr:MBL fold metallo-hydrolase [Clostridium polyendosporum]GIM27548.1 MBL fold metallo-hydrolase [Clostridium polyendosporum]
MAKLYILGTGNAMVTNCYNTCFTISNDEGEHFLIDTGGGNTLLSNLEKLNIPISKINNLFISHTHNDHINGISWIVRAIAQAMINNKYDGNFTIYGHEDVLKVGKTLCNLVLQDKFTKLFNERILFVPIKDGERKNILDFDITFFDIHSEKLLQYGFRLTTKEGIVLSFIGDEPYKEVLNNYCTGSDYLIHEAFCLYEERDFFNPYEKHHTTVKEACENSTLLENKNLILIHTEDKNIRNRKEYYTAEARYFYQGNIIVPDDLDVIDLVPLEN